jgi:hypothetical protein
MEEPLVDISPIEEDPSTEEPAVDPSPPTPPPEPSTKSSKKERTKIDRTAGGSWALWGAAPPPKKSAKKTSRTEKESQPPPPEEAPEEPRSKPDQARRRKVRDSQNETEKSSSSDKDKNSESKRPSRTGAGLSNFILGGPPPSSKSKSDRKSGTSRPVSRRPSVDVEDTGLISPPPDDKLEVSDKAAKLMGIKPSKSGRERSGMKKRRSKFDSANIYFQLFF